MSPDRSRYPPSPRHIKLKPITGATMMELAVDDKKRDAALCKRETDRVNFRTSERLAIAENRHRDILNQLEGDRENKKATMQRQVELAEAETTKEGMASTRNGLIMHGLTREQHQLEAQHQSARQQAWDGIASTHDFADRHASHIDAELQASSTAAAHTIEALRADARAQLDKLQQRRASTEAKAFQDMHDREQRAREIAERAHVQGSEEVRRSEVTRHRAALTVDLAGEKAQATRTTAQEKVRLNEQQAAKETSSLAKAGHLVQADCSVSIRDKIKNSAVELEAAHHYCKQIKHEVANQATMTKRKFGHMDANADAHAKEIERHVNKLEKDRLESFVAAQAKVQSAEEQFRNKRAVCEKDLEAVNQRLREVEEETLARAQRLLEQWIAGNKAAEDSVRDLERKGRNAIKEMQALVNKRIQDSLSQNTTLQENGTAEVARLERQANLEMDSTQPRLEAARHTDEEMAEKARAAWRELRPRPEMIRAAADADIERIMGDAREEESRLMEAADQKVEAAKVATKLAHGEEKWLLAEAAEAWARIRTSCYQLRLVNLHDFAQGIIDGAYDLPQPLDSGATMRPPPEAVASV